MEEFGIWNLWPTKREIAEEEACDRLMHDLFNRLCDDGQVLPPADRLRGWRWTQLRAKILLRDCYTCRYCGVSGGRLECDHVIPISRGGSNEEENLVAACYECNRSKRDKSVEEWRACAN